MTADREKMKKELMKFLEEHFMDSGDDDEEDLEGGEKMKSMNPYEKKVKLKRGRYFKPEDEEDRQEDYSDEMDEDESEEDEESKSPELDKEKRKRIAVILMAKKAAKPGKRK